MIEDAELLRRYAEEKSEEAFAELVRRRIGLVYSVALRHTHDAHRAEDVTQAVFNALARKAGELAKRPVLVGWLYRSAQFAASDAVRAERRRQAREQEAHTMQEITREGTEPDWEKLQPVLDEVLNGLNESDRDAVLLRFFDGQPFAEIGRKLQLTENTARMRVERALDKLHAQLARRGVTSTTAALGVALANQVSVAAPAGLAASIAGSALSSASGVATGTGISILTFMSTAKIAAGGLVAVVVLGVSLCANAYFLFREPPANVPAAAVPTAAPPLASAPVLSEPVSLVKNTNLAALRDQLRATGASDASIRAALEGILRRRYREQLSADRAARLSRGWWRDPQRTWGTANDPQLPFDDLRLMNEMVAKPLEQLLGVDPLDEAEADVRYAFLPPVLRQEFSRLDRSGIYGWTLSGQPDVDAAIEAEVDRSRRAVEDKRKELMAALTPEQRTDYEMRFGEFASGLARQLEQVAATEQEFRAVFLIADGYAKELAALATRDGDNAAKAELDRRTAQQLIAAFGYDRALDYIWAGTTEFPAYARIARDANLPPTTAGRIVQLAAETADRAVVIHADAALTVGQKRTALLALQQTVRPQFDALFPPEAQQRLAPAARAWIDALGEGRYKTIATVLPGRTRTMTMGSSMSVDAPIPPRSLPAPSLVPARPSRN